MTRSLLGGAGYFLIVFACAFALGAVRVSFVAPAMGAFWATALEAPFTLAISWIACDWVSRRMGAPSLGNAIGMGATAFVLLMGAEAAGAILLFDRTLGEFVNSYRTPAGALGLAGQIAFALFPIFQYQRAANTAPLG